MRWSVSKSKVFFQCQRKWYFSDCVASHGKKDLYRREVFLLKQLRSIYAWRGSLVDTVIERKIVPAILQNRIPSENQVLSYASKLIEDQLDFGKSQKFRDPDITKTKAGDIYTAFYDLEYNGSLDENKLLEAKEEIKIALQNLLNSELLKEIAQKASYVIAQRSFTYNFDGTTITCTPDLLVFFDKTSPMIVDWKVHTFATTEYWLQLGIYGYILSLMKPHRDFPPDLQKESYNATKLRLIEYQLLKNKIREYKLSDNDIADIEDYIFESITQMSLLMDDKRYNELDKSQFKTAYSPNLCIRCEFKKVCWEDDAYESN